MDVNKVSLEEFSKLKMAGRTDPGYAYKKCKVQDPNGFDVLCQEIRVRILYYLFDLDLNTPPFNAKRIKCMSILIKKNI
jgi:hypothetical protein